MRDENGGIKIIENIQKTAKHSEETNNNLNENSFIPIKINNKKKLIKTFKKN